VNKEAKIFIVGHEDVMHYALCQYFYEKGHRKIFSSFDLAIDTTSQAAVNYFFSEERPEYVFLGSVSSGGIQMNQQYLVDLFYRNSQSQNNIIYAAHKFGVKRILYAGSSCVYPKDCPQPMTSDNLMTGPMEPTSESYAMAKLSGITLCRAYKKQYGLNVDVVIPATVYGPGVMVEPENAHVIEALIDRFYQAMRQRDRQVVVWGSGKVRRDFIFSEDFARGCYLLMTHEPKEFITHIASGVDHTIKEIVEIIKQISHFKGDIVFDANKPDGPQQKLLAVGSMASLGWEPRVSMEQGIKQTWDWYVRHKERKL
jgi:GDP-L-fucose synthase